MKHRYMSVSAVVMALIVVLAGCASFDRKADNPDRSRLGVLIIAGEGLNSKYNDLKGDAVLFQVSSRFAELIHYEIQKRGTTAQMYINRDHNIEASAYVGKLLADKKRDGLVQITVTHVKNESENSFYLAAKYFPLKWHKDIKGDTLTTGGGPEVKYIIGGAGKDGRSFNIFAQEFADTLFKAGFIGGDY